MGFRRNIGSTFPCRLNNGYLEVAYPVTLRIKTSFEVNTDWQTNMFTGTHVWWLLIDGDTLYYGLRDGTALIVRNDGTVVAIHEWDVPEPQDYNPVGYCNRLGELNELLLDNLCPRVVHATKIRASVVLKDGVQVVVPSETSLAMLLRDAIAGGVTSEPVISLKGGVAVVKAEQGHWESVEDLSTVQYLQFR